LSQEIFMAQRPQTVTPATRKPAAKRPASRTHREIKQGAAAAATPVADRAAQITPEEREHMIAKAAYMRAQMRGFEPGHEMQDWLEAEAEIDRRISK
jgi:hypothetical protein